MSLIDSGYIDIEIWVHVLPVEITSGWTILIFFRIVLIHIY